MTSPTSTSNLAAAAEAAELKRNRDAALAEIKGSILRQLANLGIARIDAEIRVASRKAVIHAITAYTDGDDIRDLTDTLAVESGPGENLQDYIRGYLTAVLQHQRHEHLTGGILHIWVASGGVVQPIDHAARDAAQSKERADQLKADKAAIITTLKELGVARVHAEYDGEGDEGQISEINAYGADDTKVPLDCEAPFILGAGDATRSFTSLHACIEQFAWDVLEHHHDHFEDGDGGFGTIIIDVAEDIAKVEHNWNIRATEYVESEI